MGNILRSAITLLVAVNFEINLRVVACSDSAVKRAFEDYNIVPDYINNAPVHKVKVCYPSGVEVNLGNKLTPTQVKDEPSVYFSADSEKYYVLILTDPHPYNQHHHWLVGNIPGNNMKAGETIFEFLGTAPPPDTGFHLYVFFVYQQPGKLNFDEPRLDNSSTVNRTMFTLKTFSEKYGLGDPVSGNFYQAEFDDYTLVLFRRLGVQLV